MLGKLPELSGSGLAFGILEISKIKAWPQPLRNRIKTFRFEHFSGHLKSGVHDRPFKQHLTRVLNMRPEAFLATPSEVSGSVLALGILEIYRN
jgi:hypothetical protein